MKCPQKMSLLNYFFKIIEEEANETILGIELGEEGEDWQQTINKWFECSVEVREFIHQFFVKF